MRRLRIDHTIEMTKKRGLPPSRLSHYADAADDCSDCTSSFVDPSLAPPNSGLLPASRADLTQSDPVAAAQQVVSDTLAAGDQITPQTKLMLRVAVGTAAAFSPKLPGWARVLGGIWGLYPVWQSFKAQAT